MPGREGQESDLRISHRVIREQSQATIKTLMDAVVELVTNSDDSYRRLDAAGDAREGLIEVYVRRSRGGVVSDLVVTDYAEGMTLNRIEEVLEFAADTSGFTSGKNIRGLFGKGLKEAIFALGEGVIESVKAGAMSVVAVAKDETSGNYRSRIEQDGHPSMEPDYTRVAIKVSNENINSPRWGGLSEQFRTHFALRDICSESRKVLLSLQDTGMTRRLRMTYSSPEVTLAIDKSMQVEGLGEVRLVVNESEQPLHLASRDPHSIAGIVVKTEGIPLDNRAFGFENDEAAQYFTGSVEVPGIARVLRNNDFSLLDPSRGGLAWRNSNARRLEVKIIDEFRPLIDRKRAELEANRRTSTREGYRRKLMDVCDLLNRLADDEIEEMPRFGREETQLEGLVIRPDVGYARLHEERRFSLYMPSVMANETSPVVSLSFEDVQGDIRSSTDAVPLVAHRSNSDVLTGSFEIRGDQEGSSCLIYATYGQEEDMAEFRVGEPSHRERPNEPRNRGLFREVNFDDQRESPIQRVSFNNGNITIFLRFPPISRYLGAGGDGMNTPLGSMMCAELVAEAFSREVARRRFEAGTVVPAQGGEIDAYNSELNTLSRKYLHRIHEALVQG